MPAVPLPAEFHKGRPATPEDLRAEPNLDHATLHTVERCIASHHIVDIDYTDAAGRESVIRIRPAYIRYNTANHIVLWGMRADEDGWEEFRFDRMRAVRDTGEEFKPTW